MTEEIKQPEEYEPIDDELIEAYDESKSAEVEEAPLEVENALEVEDEKYAEIREFYNKHFNKRQAAWRHEGRDRFIYEIATKHIKPTKILDIGCGNGHTLAYFQQRLPDALYFGIDISDVACELAKKAVNGTIVNEPFLEWKTTRRFDLVLNLGTLEHFEDLNASILKMKSFMSKGGLCYFEAPNNLAYSPGEETFRRLKSGSQQMEWHLSMRSWEKFFKRHKLDIVKRYKGFKRWWEFVWILK